MNDALKYADQHADAFVGQLEDWLRIPSISADSKYADDVRAAAEWLADEFRRIGMDSVEVMETPGHPVVYAEKMVDPDKPTVLVYGHYDVQPPDPLELWDTPPFEPTRKGDDLYARGSSDDKGQLFMHVKAAEAYLQSGDALPLNVKFMVEGEEEVGSEHLADFIETHRDKLAADVVVVSDTALFDADVPSITYGLRGLAYIEVELTGPNRDLHSGVYGGAVENPANALATLIAGLHDENHRVTVEGFYDDVEPLSDDERAAFASLPFNEQAWKDSIGIDAIKTEGDYTKIEGTTARPTLDVNGLWSGYQGEGAKTVLPSKAGAKISCRLVPNQTPDDIYAKLRAHFEKHTPDTMTLDFRVLHGGHGVVVDRSHPAMQAAKDAMGDVFGKEPVFTREGGSIPVVSDFKRILGLDTVLMGFGLNTDALHSPNEHFGLDRFQKGILTGIRFLDAYAKQ